LGGIVRVIRADVGCDVAVTEFDGETVAIVRPGLTVAEVAFLLASQRPMIADPQLS
jgi:uncharacterized integral membrane protein